MEILSTSTTETNKLATRIAKNLQPGDILTLYGDLGSGKTTFVGFLTKALKIEARVQSPTFVILRRYSDTPSAIQDIKTINHLDLYRLTSPTELEDLDLSNIFNEENAITIIEWPEIVENYLVNKAIKIRFEYINETTRKIIIPDNF